jgi:hypothetical protein
MIQYIYLKDNLSWQGAWSEFRSYIQMWRKELKLSLADKANIHIRANGTGDLDLTLHIKDVGCDSRNVPWTKVSSWAVAPIDQADTWRIFASGAEWIGENAALHSLRVTNMETMEEVLWKAG